MIIFYIMIIAGFGCGFLLFQEIPRIILSKKKHMKIKLSVIIPARNEEHKLPLILSDLKVQTLVPHEIICVNDNSTDQTQKVIEKFKATYIEIKEKPLDWTGKTWACQVGGEKATGNLLLFLDADVRLEKNALMKLAHTFLEDGKVISVQPYHKVLKFYEHFALFFNLVGIAGNGLCFKHTKKRAGLFGPVILMSKHIFKKIEGYRKVRKSVIEDVALGKVLNDNDIGYRVFVGDSGLSFRMYPTFKELFLGFTKNFASGATKSPLVVLLFSFLWITSITAVPLLLLETIVTFNKTQLLVGLVCYILIFLQLIFISKNIGSFKKKYTFIYPVFLIVFHLIFFYSIYAKVFKKKVTWKGRDISL